MLGPSPKHQNLYRRNLKQIARMAHYEPIASIPQPSQDFNYTLVKNRYSDYYQNPKVVKKVHQKSSQQVKLTTILETHGRSPLFPKISQGKKQIGDNTPASPKRKVKGLRAHFSKEHDTTVTSRERSLTIDTRLDTQQDLRNQNESQIIDDIPPTEKKPRSLGFQTAERQNLQSNSSELSSLISRRRYKEPSYSYHNRSAIVQAFNDDILNEEDDQSDDDEEYCKEANPGPGSYEFSYSDFDKKRSTRSTNVSFLSKLTRFNYSCNKQPAPVPKVQNSVKEELAVNRDRRLKERLKKKAVPFNSKSPRKFESDELAKIKVPGPENYYPRLGMEEDLIRNIQRHFKGNFGSNQPRFVQSTPQYPHIGPGTYEKPPEEDLLAGENYYFRSKIERFQE